MSENDITRIIIDCAYQLHVKFGPGLFESVYEELLAHELGKRRIRFSRQVILPLTYEGIKLDLAFKADLVIEEKIIVEVKSVDFIAPIHQKQLLTYLRVTGLQVGLIINFNEALIKNGICRIVNKYRA
jgi:GxxExxY protein